MKCKPALIIVVFCLLLSFERAGLCRNVLTMDAAVSAALSANPEVAAANAAFDAARARPPQAATPPDPEKADFFSIVEGIRALNSARLTLARARADAAIAYSDLERAFAGGSYFFMGDGKVAIGGQKIRFRDDGGAYIAEGLKKINGLYGTNWDVPEERMSVRLIELLDFIEDRFGAKGMRIVSGYRDPDYNRSLRDKGKLASSSSLHIDAEAVDVVMGGVPSAKIYEYLVQQNCCGAGYYHGKAIHIDTGPPRFWDEKTSGTETKEPPENKFIIIKTERDIYSAGEKIKLKFSRVNVYPIGVKSGANFICAAGRKNAAIEFAGGREKAKGGCNILKDRREAKNLSTAAPSIPEGAECQIQIGFCEPIAKKQPVEILSNTIVIRGTGARAGKKVREALKT